MKHFHLTAPPPNAASSRPRVKMSNCWSDIRDPDVANWHCGRGLLGLHGYFKSLETCIPVCFGFCFIQLSRSQVGLVGSSCNRQRSLQVCQCFGPISIPSREVIAQWDAEDICQNNIDGNPFFFVMLDNLDKDQNSANCRLTLGLAWFSKNTGSQRFCEIMAPKPYAM